MRALWPIGCGRFLKYLSVLFTGTLVSSVFSFATQLVLTRSLTVAEFGRIAALLAAINLFTPVASAGVNWFLIQVFGKEGWAAVRWLRSSAVLVALATGISAVLLGLYALHGEAVAGDGILVLLTCIPILFGQVAVELASSRFQLEGRYEGLAAWQAAMPTGRLVAAALVIFAAPFAAFDAVLIGYAVIGVLTTGIGVAAMRSLWTGRMALTGHSATFDPGMRSQRKASLGQTTAEATPFALMTIFYLLYFQGAVIVLEWLAGGNAAAIYNAAFLVISAIFLIPNVIYMRLLVAPMCRWAEHDRDRFAAALHVGVPAMAALGIFLSVLTSLGGKWLIPLLFGPKYAAAIPVLQILSIGIPIRFVQSAYSAMFISKENVVRKVRYLGLCALLGVAASVCLVPGFGAEGAAYAAVAAEMLLLALHMLGANSVIAGLSLLDTIRIATFRAGLRHLAQASRPAF